MTGVIYDRTGSYAPAWWMALGFSGLSMLCMWRAAPRRVRVVAGQIDRLHARRS
jgi:cyanate permease